MNTINAPTTTTNNSYLKYVTYFLGYIILLIGVILFFVYSDNSKSFNYTTMGFVFLTFALLGIKLYFFYPSMKNKNVDMTVVYIMAALILFASAISWIFLSIDQSNLQVLGPIFFGLFMGILIIGLAIVFYIFGDYLKQRRGLVGLIINFIFFIPCLLLDFVEFMKKEMQLTTRTEYILLFFELVLIIGYFFAIPIINSALSSGTIYVLKKPVFLNKQTVLMKETSTLAVQKGKGSTYNYLEQRAISISEGGTTSNAPAVYRPYASINTSEYLYSANFAISMWVYLNVQTNEFSTSAGKSYESTIFSYGLGKPKITYTNDIMDQTSRNVCNFYFCESAMKPNYQTSIPSQKWNNIVFNYSGERVDLFVNGILETTFYFDDINILPSYDEIDKITTGQNNKGLYGAICNVVYYKNNLQNNQIVNEYNVLTLKNPPIAQI